MLDRTWYNTLVGDSGTGMDGSVWGKADVDALMDAIDAELNRSGARFTSGTWVPTLAGAGGGTATYSLRLGGWATSGQMAVVSGRITVLSVGSLAGALTITGSPLAAAAGVAQPIGIGYWAGLGAGITQPVLHMNSASTAVQLFGGVTGGTAAGPLGAGNIVNGFDLIFGGTIIRL